MKYMIGLSLMANMFHLWAWIMIKCLLSILFPKPLLLDRIGYIISTNNEAMSQIIKMQYYITACSNDAMQYAVLAAMEKASDYPDLIAKEFKERCDLIVDRLNEMG